MRFVVVLLVACSSSSQSPDQDPAPDASPPPTRDAPPAVACSGKPAQPLDATWTVGGRSVQVHVPASYDPGYATPVVVNLHGLSGDGAEQARISRMLPISDASGFIAVHPDGTGFPRGWNGGDCCNPAASSGVDDTAWVGGLLDELEAKLCVDVDRVYVLGLSNGAFMAHRLGCELADRFAAIGAVAGVVGIDTCSPARDPLAVFHVHGTSDLIIPYGGGGINNSESVATTIERWTTNNGCTAAPVNVHDQDDATCVRYGGCTAGADVTLCTIDGGGHQWPGGESLGSFNGKKSDNLIASEAAWAFFAAHPRPASR